MLGWVNILRHGNLQGEELKQGLDIIERNARVQAQIIEDLLDMSRIISGKIRLDTKWIDLSAVLNESIETLRSAAQAKGVSLQARLDPSAQRIFGDPNRLQQVFWNLLNSAIKFTPKDGKVEVLLKHTSTEIQVSGSWLNCMAATSEFRGTDWGKVRHLMSVCQSPRFIQNRKKNVTFRRQRCARILLCQKYPSLAFKF